MSVCFIPEYTPVCNLELFLSLSILTFDPHTCHQSFPRVAREVVVAILFPANETQMADPYSSDWRSSDDWF